uniref:Uncharacterized protein n=1 Tax=Anguilla anguilla TaxID=7936 RepID=A0A0E9PF34_ANGAN
MLFITSSDGLNSPVTEHSVKNILENIAEHQSREIQPLCIA